MASTEFKESVDKALKNANLTGALGRFSEAYAVARKNAYAGIDFEQLRGRVAAIKGYAAEHMDELAEQFTKAATARGAKVFRANSPQQVKEYIANLCREKGVKRIVKSKSMATEEIHLNDHLIKQGIQVNETDLGEWIIQLAGQTPSHMVMPAIHMTRDEVADLFSKEIDERLSNDIPKLVKVARKELRTKFLQADMGITGGNMAIAETGTIALVTNEGNARLTTTLPKIHVAVVGLEKLVPNWADAAPILVALPKSATSQQLTSYVSLITGPTPNDDGSMKEMHIILMDNKRSEMAADPIFKQALQCIRCASCLNVCPVYRLVGGHVFGKVYTGGIGTILTAWFDELKRSEEIQSLCIQCGNCKQVCPGQIDIPALILEIRRRLTQEQGQGVVQKTIFSVVNNRKIFHGMLRAASKVQGLVAKDGFIRHLPMFLSELSEFRSLPAIADKPFRDVFDTIQQPVLQKKIAFYGGCLIDFAYPEMGVKLVKILNKAGYNVTFPKDQTCCGAPARYNGAYEVAADNATDNIKALLSEEVDYVVSACPTCTCALKHEFIEVYESVGRRDMLPKARRLATKTVDFSTLVKQLVDEGKLSFKEGQSLGTITYHDSCHLKRTLHAENEPRELLTQAGYQIEEMFECDMCCGMGGSYSLKFPEISKPILTRKLGNIKASGAQTVAMDCPGCVMQIKGGFDKDGARVNVKHTVELLADQLK
ncbi:L-lactate dehydrogenase (quinone) large subunit LdhH [Fundidesulfovibrio putealis]|uniref:L-lactate dehydrogenase (quinone) large subunit LdhH n=1 Tax=Fundidesulfovibrio putealis TaxID=270496 RepID=UPI00040FC4BF|nr:LUD domain-containing protein [Fundidesulfovibrio putealis]